MVEGLRDRKTPKSDGADERGDVSRILVWGTPRTTGRGGHRQIASIRTEQPADRKGRAGGRPGGDRIPEEMDGHGDSRWDFPWKRALFTSDGPDSTTFDSDTPESHADRPPDVEYSERLMTEKRQYEGGTERLCSSYIKLEMAVMQLQKDLDDCHTEFEITRKLTPVDSSEKGVPVRELIWPSVLGEPLVDCLQEPMPGEKSLEYTIQATASVWMPFEQVHSVESGDVDFDSFGMATWDAGGMHSCTRSEPFRTMMLQWLMRLLCRLVSIHRLDRTMTMYTENGLDTVMMITTDSPRLTETPGEWDASDVFTQTRHDLRHTYDISAVVDCNAVVRNDLIFRRLSLPPEDVSAGHDGKYGFPKIDSAVADSGAVEMNDLIFRRLSLPPEYDSAAVDYDTGAVGLDDLIFRRLIFPAGRICRQMEYCRGCLWHDEDRGHDFPPHEFAAGRIFRRAER